MELNDQSKGKTPGGTRAKAARLDAEAAAEAHVEEEIEKDVAEYKDELVTKEETDELEVEKEAVAEDGIEAAAEKPEADKGAAAPEYPRSYEAPLHPIAKRESLIKRLRPYYLTAAGLLLIARIVVYSLRRRRR